MAPGAHSVTGSDKPVKAAAKTAANSSFGANMPVMSSAFDTAMWLTGWPSTRTSTRLAGLRLWAGFQGCSFPLRSPPSDREGPTPLGSLF